MILEHLRSDIFANLILPLVCKAFRTLIRVPLESDFPSMNVTRSEFERLQRRNDESWRAMCERDFGIYGGSTDLNWEQMWRATAVTQCLRCGNWRELDILSKVWTAVPGCIRVCRHCQHGTIYGTIGHEEALGWMHADCFAHLPYISRWRTKDARWEARYHRGTFMKIYERKMSQCDGIREHVSTALKRLRPGKDVAEASPSLEDHPRGMRLYTWVEAIAVGKKDLRQYFNAVDRDLLEEDSTLADLPLPPPSP